MVRRSQDDWRRPPEGRRTIGPARRRIAGAGAVVAAIWLGPAIASAQVMFVDEVAIGLSSGSNEQPGRPLQLPPASTEVKEAFDDFERFSRRGAWERAFRALDAIPDDQDGRFVDRDDGFVIRVSERRRDALSSLSPEGREAFRLFADTEARRLLEQAVGPAEQETLERLFAGYFLTSVGDEAADRLGDLHFERGRFDRAAECWLAILRDYPDSGLSPGQLAVKAAIALHRAGREAEADELRRELAGRYATEEIEVAGERVAPEDYLRRVLDEGDDGASPADPGEELPVLGTSEDASWQVRLGDSVAAGLSDAELQQWEANPYSRVVPRVAADDDRLFANYLGHVFAVDLGTGKMLWRTYSFHDISRALGQNQGMRIDATRYAILATGGRVFGLERDLRDQNYAAPFRLVCRGADSGDVIWQSTEVPELARFDPIGGPLPAGDRMFLVARTSMNQPQPQPDSQRGPGLFVLAIRPSDGKILWETEVGSLRMDQRHMYYGMQIQEPQPQLLLRKGALYVDTHAGILARLDAETGELDWGYGYETEPVQGGNRVFISSNQVPMPVTAAGCPVAVGGALVVKGAKSDRIAAVDPDRMAVLWDRPMARSARLLGAVGDAVILGGPEVDALDLESRGMLWSNRLPGGSYDGRPIVRDDGIWHLTPRGIFELDPGDGRVRRVFRGGDTGSAGGDLLLTDRLLIAVSNRTISAYDRRPDAEAEEDDEDEDSRTTEGGED